MNIHESYSWRPVQFLSQLVSGFCAKKLDICFKATKDCVLAKKCPNCFLKVGKQVYLDVTMRENFTTHLKKTLLHIHYLIHLQILVLIPIFQMRKCEA